MVFIYSNDPVLVNLCKDLFAKKDGLKQLSQMKSLSNAEPRDEDVLILDFEYIAEKELPSITCACMILVTIPQYDQAMRLLQKGIRAYGNRHLHEDNLVQAVETLKAGQIWLPPAFLSQMISTLPKTRGEDEENDLLKDLTSREEEVAKWLANGLSNKEISEKMFVSIRTVKAHLTSIFKKTGCRDRLELATRLK